MIPSCLSFVDVETTGMSPRYGRIIEIGILRVENGKIVDQFSSLVNPHTVVDPFIQSMTGITAEDLQNAPSFYQIKDRIKEILKDSLFVAHNVLFDYMFLKNEFQRHEEEFSSKYFCTVKLSKRLYPRFKRHNLDALIERFDFECLNRHRAFDDAKILFDFYNLSLKKLGPQKVGEAIDRVMKRPSLPIGISSEELDSVPEACGVYIFYNKDNAPLYIGKSVNLRDRVMSHFANSKRDSTDAKIAQDIKRIEVIETAGELGALLMEATLVKKMQPLYNRQLRYAYKLLAIKKTISDKTYNSLEVVNLQEVEVDQLSQVLGIFKNKNDLRQSLVAIAKEYKLCPKLLGLEKIKGSCFNYHLELCLGACLEKEMPLKYNLRFDEAFYKTKIREWPFEGPIGLKERSKKEEVFVIDKWCVLGKLQNTSDSLDDLSKDYLFDTDTYKILNRYLNSNKDFEVFNL